MYQFAKQYLGNDCIMLSKLLSLFFFTYHFPCIRSKFFYYAQDEAMELEHRYTRSINSRKYRQTSNIVNIFDR